MLQVLVTAESPLAAASWPAVRLVPGLTFPGTLRGTLTGVLGSEWTLAYPLVSQGLEGWGGPTAALRDPARAMAIAQSLLEDKDCILQLRFPTLCGGIPGGAPQERGRAGLVRRRLAWRRL